MGVRADAGPNIPSLCASHHSLPAAASLTVTIVPGILGLDDGEDLLNITADISER